MIEVKLSHRAGLAKLGGTQLTVFDSHNPHVLAYTRNGALLMMCNFSENPQKINAATLSAMPMVMTDILSGASFDVWDGLELSPYQVLCLSMA